MRPDLRQHDALVAGLLRATAYPEPVETVSRIETHISTVLLAGAHAYKIKKPLDLGFLDFSTLEKRRQACEAEVRLNRRTAAELYLDVVTIVGPVATPRILTGPVAAADDVIDYAVRMRRFDPQATLDRLAARGALDAGMVDRLADSIARFHAETPAAPASFGEPATVERWALENFAAMRLHVQSAADRARLDALEAWTRAESAALRTVMSTRVRSGRVRECHGDLHLGNVALIDGRPVAFDAVEFNDELRCIDVASDLAFTFMDLLDHALPRLAWRFVSAYLEASGDYEGLAVLRYYAVYRALVRAKVALIRLHQPQVSHHVRVREHTSFEHYLALAERLQQQGAAVLVAMCGLSGSGKSTVAQTLAELLGGVRVRSDVERRRLFGIPGNAPTGGAIYTPAANEATYARLGECARAGIVARVPVVLDAAFLRRAERERMRALAQELGASFAVAACTAPLDVLRARVAGRRERGLDPSEADLAVLERQLGGYERPGADEAEWTCVIDTGPGAPLEDLGAELAEALLAPISRPPGAPVRRSGSPAP
jgi:hypothetical protein